MSAADSVVVVIPVPQDRRLGDVIMLTARQYKAKWVHQGTRYDVRLGVEPSMALV